MDGWLVWLGIGIGTGGLIASVAGLVFAFLARRAAKSAEAAAREARKAVVRTLRTIEVERAVSLISRVKEIHHQRNWDYALGLYQDLRRTLSEIAENLPPNLLQYRTKINGDVPQITAMENLVRQSRYENREPEDVASLDNTLSEIQQELEALQSSRMYSYDRGSN